MCNLYSVTKPQAAIRELAKASVDNSGNLPVMPAIFPDQMAPVVMTRPNDGQRELQMMRWGFPAPLSSIPFVTNVRNTSNSWWRPYLRAEYRCFAGKDRWCVTWKVYTDSGDFLPHDRCPMAEAIIKKQPIRNVAAIAERPDGTRVDFMPYPTPLFCRNGELRGAVNVLIDVTDQRQASLLRVQARKCARLSGATGDNEVKATLNRLAHEYEAKALALESRSRQRSFPTRPEPSKTQPQSRAKWAVTLTTKASFRS